MQSGVTVALVSDAGTPGISDPGFDLVRACAAAGIEIIAIPGPCAAVAALSIAALPTDRFCFEGFLPARSAARRARLDELALEPRTLVFYESPHRVHDMLEDCARILGPERPATVAREITKLHETLYRGSLSQLARSRRSGGGFCARRNRLGGRGRAAPRRRSGRGGSRRAGPRAQAAVDGAAAQASGSTGGADHLGARQRGVQAGAAAQTRSSREEPSYYRLREACYGAHRSRPGSRCVREHMEESPGSTGHGAR